MGMDGLGKGLILVGLVLIVLGALITVSPRWPWLGRLPGDVWIHRGRFTLVIPLTTCLLLSALGSLIAWLIWRRR